MTTRAREFLKQYEEAERIVLRLKNEYKEEQEKIDSIRSSVGDGTPHGGGISNTVEVRAMKLAEKAEEWKEAEADALQIRQEVVRVINKVPGEKGAILYERYVNLKKWDEVADTVGYSLRQVHNLHREALDFVNNCILLHILF